ncbi:hypothetical protein QJQ45_021183 [Haematococcus lacustris]|nr:hypothetical protein QJQ45_021183 [Haematococcus lacustris]
MHMTQLMLAFHFIFRHQRTATLRLEYEAAEVELRCQEQYTRHQQQGPAASSIDTRNRVREEGLGEGPGLGCGVRHTKRGVKLEAHDAWPAHKQDKHDLLNAFFAHPDNAAITAKLVELDKTEVKGDGNTLSALAKQMAVNAQEMFAHPEDPSDSSLAEDPSDSRLEEDPSGSSSKNKRQPADIGSSLTDKRAFQFDPATQMGMGLDLGANHAVSAASGRWNDKVKLELQHLAAATSARTSLVAILRHVAVTLATWDAMASHEVTHTRSHIYPILAATYSAINLAATQLVQQRRSIPVRQLAQPSPAQPSPAQPSPAQPSPAQPSPAQPSPAQPSPAQPSPAQPSPAQPSPAQPSPAQPSPAQPSPAQPSPAQPSPAQPSPAQPSPAQPSPAQPSPAQPSPAQPSPAQPSPAQPSPAQPSPAQPSPAQPSPAQPSPTQPYSPTLHFLLRCGAKAVLQACRKVVERPNRGRPTDTVEGEVVTVDEFRTRRVNSAMNSPQPSERKLDRSEPT